MSPITRRIMEAAQTHECDTGSPPDHLYLGTKAFDELRVETQRWCTRLNPDPLPPGVAAVFRGMNLYVVMDYPDHLNVA